MTRLCSPLCINSNCAILCEANFKIRCTNEHAEVILGSVYNTQSVCDIRVDNEQFLTQQCQKLIKNLAPNDVTCMFFDTHNTTACIISFGKLIHSTAVQIYRHTSRYNNSIQIRMLEM